MLLKLREKFRRYIGIIVGSDVEPEIKALAVMFEKLAVVLNEEQVDMRTGMTKQFIGLNRKIDNRNNTNIVYKTKLSVLINGLISEMFEIKLEPHQIDAIDATTNLWLEKTFKNTTFIAKSAKHKIQ